MTPREARGRAFRRAGRVGGPLQARQRHDGQTGQSRFPISAYAGIAERLPFQRHEVAELRNWGRRQRPTRAQAVKIALDPFRLESGDAPAIQDGMVETDAEMDFIVRDQMDVDPPAGSLAPVVAPAPFGRDMLRQPSLPLRRGQTAQVDDR